MGTRTIKFYGQAYSDDGTPVEVEATFDGQVVYSGTVPTYNLDSDTFAVDDAQYEARTIEQFSFDVDTDVHGRGVAFTIRPIGGSMHVNTIGLLKMTGRDYDEEYHLHSSHQKTDMFIDGIAQDNDQPPNTGMVPNWVGDGSTFSCVFHVPSPWPSNHDFDGPEWTE